MPARVILHVDLDAFFAAVEQRDHPALRGKPVVVGADPKAGRGRGVVSTCSYEARRYGIHSAMPISLAYQRCPQAAFVPVRMDRYSEISDQVFKILCDFSPDIEPLSIDEAFLDMTASYHLFGSPLAAGQEMRARIRRRTGLTASVGIAPVKMAAKVASDLCKPDGILEVAEGRVREFLAPLPISRLWGVGPKTQAALEQWGLRTIGDLACRPREYLVERLGESGAHLHDLANGIDPRAVSPAGEVKSVSNEHTFEADTADLREMERTLLALSEQVSRRLRQNGLKGRTLTVKIRLKGFKTYTRARTLEQRTNFAEVIYREARAILLEFYRRGMQVRLIGVRLANFEDPYIAETLFPDPRQEKRERVHAVVDAIKDRFGEDAIHRAV